MTSPKRCVAVPAARYGALAGVALALVLSAVGLADTASVYGRKWTAVELEETLRQSKEWLGNTIGRAQTAPPPWTPMQVRGQSVECWGRVYRYENSVLPVQILSQGVELLAGRPRFVVTSGGRRFDMNTAEVSVERKHDGLVTVRTVSRAGPFTLNLAADYEFDGLGKMHMRLSASEPLEAEGLHLEIPLRTEQSILFHVTGTRFGIEVGGEPIPGAAWAPLSDSGFVPAAGARLDAFREIVWLGNREVGFTWMAESMEGWPIRDEENIQVIGAHEHGRRIFRVKFADRPFSLAQPLDLVFGLQATPMRPRPQDFRSRVGSNRAILWQWFWGDGSYYPFQETYPSEARADVEAARERGLELMPCSSVEYFGAYRFSRGKYGLIDHPGLRHREVLFWEELWNQIRTHDYAKRFDITPQEALRLRDQALQERRTVAGGRSLETVLTMDRHTAPGDDWHDVRWQPRVYPRRFCYHSSFPDFYLWKLRTLIEQTSLNAIYLDQQLYACANHEHGCGYINYKDEWDGTGNLFAMREMAKRIYILFYEQNGRPPLIKWHCSQQVVVPAMSFADIYYDGEKYNRPNYSRSIVDTEFYSTFLDPAVLQVQHMGRPFGFTACFLPQITRDESRGQTLTSPTIATIRDMLGVMMIHDSHVSSGHTRYPQLIERVQDVRLSYPLAEMEVVYYWEEDSGIRTTPETVKAILHYHARQALLILFNWGDETLLAEALLDADKLGVTPGVIRAKDALTGEGVDVVGSTIRCDLLPRDFRMLELNW